ncbi:MAG TPA: hypothetical protein VIS76_16435 [Pseudomonadales bacterium]
MLEELTSVLSPMLGGVLVVIAVVCFLIGRASASGARRREEALKREVLDAKASVPQLESQLRNRDQQIVRLQEEVGSLNERSNDLLRQQDQLNTELLRARREAKNLDSELSAVRGARRSDDNLVVDGFEDELAGEPGNSAVVTQLKRTEALYERLKGALIQRDERIEALEERLRQPPGEASTIDHELHEPEPSTDTKTLEDKISDQRGIIDRLEEQLSGLRKEKEMLEDLASRRSRSNRALKDASAQIEARVPALEQQLTERDRTIVAREASIKRYLDEIESARSTIATRDASIDTLTADLREKTGLLETSDEREGVLRSTISAREARIDALDRELSTTLGVVRSLERDVADANERIEAQRYAAESARLEAEDRLVLLEKRQQSTDADRIAAERDAAARKREIEDLQSNLKQHQQWLEKLKTSLEEKETRGRESQRLLEAARAELDDANAQLRRHHEERQSAADEQHELEREIVSLRSRDEQIRAQLAEHAQTLSVYKSMLADRDFRLHSLDQAAR